MKLWTALLVFALTAPALARTPRIGPSEVIVSTRFNATDGDTTKSIAVSLSAKGKLSVTVSEFADFWSNRPAKVRTVRKQLPASVLDQLVSKARVLAQAELVTTHADVVCMLMPGPHMVNQDLLVAQTFNYDTEKFYGPLKVVLTQDGCWIADRTKPKYEWEQRAADALKAQLQVLALVYTQK